MPEWSIGTVSKTVVPLRVPRVRIPVFPPKIQGASPKGGSLNFSDRQKGTRRFVIAQRFRSTAKKESLSFRQQAKSPHPRAFCFSPHLYMPSACKRILPPKKPRPPRPTLSDLSEIPSPVGTSLCDVKGVSGKNCPPSKIETDLLSL